VIVKFLKATLRKFSVMCHHQCNVC